MGKVRRVRAKYHESLKKSKSLTNLPQVEEKKNELPLKNDLFKSTENIFAGIDISLNDITKTLPKDFDVRSIASTKSRRELREEERHLSKKEKRKLRHERFLKKLELTHQLLKNHKSKKKKKKGKEEDTSMRALLDALPTLESLAANSSMKDSKKSTTKSRGVLKAKKRLKQQSFDSKLLKNIINDKTFKANPFESISQFLKQKVAAEKKQ